MGDVIHPDLVLIKRIQNDDRLALNTLFTSYYRSLCSFAFTYLRNKEESEEIVSDLFMTLWRTRYTLSIDRNVKAYLYVSVKNAALASIKKSNPKHDNIEDIVFDTALLDTRDPAAAMIVIELQSQIDEAVERLPERCKQIFIMSRMHALTYREISEILGVAEKTVENQIVKALDVIRKRIKKINQDTVSLTRSSNTGITI